MNNKEFFRQNIAIKGGATIRPSTLRYCDSNKLLKDIAGELGVNTITFLKYCEQ